MKSGKSTVKSFCPLASCFCFPPNTFDVEHKFLNPPLLLLCWGGLKLGVGDTMSSINYHLSRHYQVLIESWKVNAFSSSMFLKLRSFCCSGGGYYVEYTRGLMQLEF